MHPKRSCNSSSNALTLTFSSAKLSWGIVRVRKVFDQDSGFMLSPRAARNTDETGNQARTRGSRHDGLCVVWTVPTNKPEESPLGAFFMSRNRVRLRCRLQPRYQDRICCQRQINCSAILFTRTRGGESAMRRCWYACKY